MKKFLAFVTDGLGSAMRGSIGYQLWMGGLTLLMLIGTYCYYIQIQEGLAVTGMSDRVSWGLYISNFTFLVGVAAAAVMLVLPTYVLKDVDFSHAVLIGEGMAVAALVMCLAFVTVDIGGPARAWHLIPGIGRLNFPRSMLAWDVIVLNGYLFLNLTVPLYILFRRYRGLEPVKAVYLPAVMVSVFWAVAIHMVTAFLYAGLPARPFWNSSLMGPRFLASAFAAGPSLIILAMMFIRKYTEYNIPHRTVRKVAMVVTVAAQVNIIMLISELFKEFYAPTHHSLSAQYVFFGLDGHNSLVPWIYTSLALNVLGTIMLTVHTFRNHFRWMTLAAMMVFVGVWIEKGMGLIIPGFIPGPWGEVVDYAPTGIEIGVTLGIWALGIFVFTILVKVALPIEMGILRYDRLQAARTAAHRATKKDATPRGPSADSATTM